jgi:hypothetical protein
MPYKDVKRRKEYQDAYNKQRYSDPAYKVSKCEYARKTRLRCKTACHQWIFNYLKENPCSDCGITDIRVLEFDHIPGQGKKLFNIMSSLSSTSLSRLVSEVAKCEVVCANCHRIRTMTRSKGWRLFADVSD